LVCRPRHTLGSSPGGAPIFMFPAPVRKLPCGPGQVGENPALNTPSAVLSPGSLLVKNATALPGGASVPPGASLMMVVPVPCVLVLSLKLLTRTSPADSVPPAGKWPGTKATPYGLRSPLAGMVDELTSRCSWVRFRARQVSAGTRFVRLRLDREPRGHPVDIAGGTSRSVPQIPDSSPGGDTLEGDRLLGARGHAQTAAMTSVCKLRVGLPATVGP
jgi:hypothetical protein